MGENGRSKRAFEEEIYIYIYIYILTIAMTIGGIINEDHFTRYKSAKMSSMSSPPDFEVNVKDISIPAITFSSSWTTAAKCALVPEISQNCSFLHHSSNEIPDHFTSKMASAMRHIVMIRR
jgi:hypothetical protein